MQPGLLAGFTSKKDAAAFNKLFGTITRELYWCCAAEGDFSMAHFPYELPKPFSGALHSRCTYVLPQPTRLMRCCLWCPLVRPLAADPERWQLSVPHGLAGGAHAALGMRYAYGGNPMHAHAHGMHANTHARITAISSLT